jgi:hypothetical protein
LFFCFQMAEELKMTVGELRQRMSSDELRHWKAYYRIVERERKKNQKAR